MASPHHSSAVSQDTLITIKISVNDSLKKLKLPLRDLGASVLPDKLRLVLDIKPEQHVVLERYSDSAGGYIILDQNNPQVFKTLIRAAKAKLKLRLKATVAPSDVPIKVEEKETVKEEKPAPKLMDVMSAVRNSECNMPPSELGNSPYSQSPRESTAVDQRSIGSGIFQFKEARASQQTLVTKDEAPVPRPFSTESSSNPVNSPAIPSLPSLAFRPRESVVTSTTRPHPWSVYCNSCDQVMSNEHYHCSICDGGDYDLCQDCVGSGEMCRGVGHWLIKRFIQDGKVVNSSTEIISPSQATPVSTFVKIEPAAEKEMPGAFTDETKTLTEEARMATRTCNSCVIVLQEREFVTCTSCEDFDLCIKCHTADKHGHHPAHGFERATDDTMLPPAAETKLAPGRNVRHNAICDGCDQKIYGVRHKCLNCPDWDYCGECVKDAPKSHPRHRFAPLYQPIVDQGASLIRHFGIYCDGPLCSNPSGQSYIQGVRYKCTICHDTDFCASCEALPDNHHNRTHPLIKLKTPIRNVNVSTENEDPRGNVRVMGDHRSPPVLAASKGTETTPVQQANAATQVQTVAEFTPTEVKKEETKPIPIPVKKSIDEKPTTPMAAVPSALLQAHFVSDSVRDGMVVHPEQLFTQVWTLKNPGPSVWPAGCSVHYVGGDNMLNIDNKHPASVTAIADATESNVVGREIQVNEQVAFSIALKAPIREGKSISYWRLKAADGIPFGHRLWCDVEVKKLEQPFAAQDPVSALSAPQAAPPQSFAVPPNMQEQQAALQRMRIQHMQMARQAAQQRHLERLVNAQQAQQAQQAAVQVQAAPCRMGPVEQQQAPYDTMNLSARLATMREQQKQRREQIVAQMNAQREQMQGMKREETSSWSQYNRATGAPMGNKNAEDVRDKERCEALKQRMAEVKANILQSRENVEKVKKMVAEARKQSADDKEGGEELQGSQMVFPKLDKESPASSTYESATSSSGKGKSKAAYVENEAGEIERSATPVAVPAPVPASPSEEDFVDLDDELDILSADEYESDDGFLTDEEYDILDASDQETIASP